MISRRSALSAGAAAAAALGWLAVERRAARRAAAAEARFPPEGRILDVGGVPVHAVVRGTGPDLVMLHGAGGNAREFTFDLIDRLAPRYRCIAFDRPGLGYTGHAAPRYADRLTHAAESPSEQAALLSRAHARIGTGAPLVLGHSYGGTVALAWGLERPARALVLLGAVSNAWSGHYDLLSTVTGSAPGGAIAVPVLSATVGRGLLDRITRAIFAPGEMPDGYLDHLGAELTLRPDSLRSNARQVRRLRDDVAALERRYPDLALPVELLHGTRDRIVPAETHARALAAQLPDATLTLLGGVGHMLHHADPDAVVAAVDRAAARAAPAARR